MDIKLFQKSTKRFSGDYKPCNKYWEDEIHESRMMELIQKLYATIASKFMKEGNYTAILRQQCGKRRLEVVDQVISQSNVK